MEKTQAKSETAKAVRWDLSDLFSSIDDPRISEVLSTGQKEVAAFREKYYNKCHKLTDEGLAEAYDRLECIMLPLYKLSQYANLENSVDTSQELIKKLVARIDEAGSRLQNELLFFTLELGALPESKLAAFIQSPKLKKYTYRLQRLKDRAQYHLSEKEEQMVNLKDLTGADSYKKLYEEYTASFQFKIEVEGKLKTMNGSELRALRQDADPDLRRRAMKAFYSKYEEQKLIFAHIYNQVVKDYNIERKLRGYQSAISVMNVGNDLENKAIEALHEVTTASYPLVQRYYKLKAKCLKLDPFTLADIYAPLPQSQKTYTWEEAKHLVLESLKGFDESFYQAAKEMFDQNRIDAPTLPAKRGGAFCSSSTPDTHPYVLLNFLGRTRDVSTLSHELGHAIHAIFSQSLPLWSYHAILPLCETASVFSEMVLVDYLRKRETDKTAVISLLCDTLEDLFATSHRQNMFSRFEQACHQQIESAPMSAEALCELYESELKLMFGDSVTYTPEFNWEWSGIPHIVSVPFYVYAYNFGNLLVIALYQQYLEEGESFIPKFKKVLSLGSSLSPREILAGVGVDITDPAFWQKSMRYIESLVDELDALID